MSAWLNHSASSERMDEKRGCESAPVEHHSPPPDEHPAVVPVTCPFEGPLSKSLTVLSIKRSTQRGVFMNWADNILQT